MCLRVHLDQSSFSMTSRVNWSLTPRCRCRCFSSYFSRLATTGALKELDRPRTLSFSKYGQNIGTISTDGSTYTVDPDGAGPAPTFTISDPNFNFKSLLTNAVFRWEWKPGNSASSWFGSRAARTRSFLERCRRA